MPNSTKATSAKRPGSSLSDPKWVAIFLILVSGLFVGGFLLLDYTQQIGIWKQQTKAEKSDPDKKK